MSLVEKALRKMQESTVRVPVQDASGRSRADALPVGNAGRHDSAPSMPSRKLLVDMEVLRAAGLLAPQQEERQLAQQYRRIKRPLIASASGNGATRIENGHLIMIASAVPGEGKTFTAINLALSMSIEKDVHVLLVDADVAKPHISRVLGAADAPGLLDVLRDPDLDVEHVIAATNVPNLSFLPAGTKSAEATELLASGRMAEVVAVLGEHDRRRIVLFDSPPLLHTTEAHALAQVTGQVVVVVLAEFTPQPVLLGALEILKGHGAVSLVLNQTMRSAASGYYYYGYGDVPPGRVGG